MQLLTPIYAKVLKDNCFTTIFKEAITR